MPKHVKVRTHFAFERAYPFDWWITPFGSALYMLDPSFKFGVLDQDLIVLEAGGVHNAIYNRRLHVLHHHDFRRVNHKVSRPSQEVMQSFNEKYRFLFRRMHEDICAASRVLFVSNGLSHGLTEIEFDSCSTAELKKPLSLREVSDRLQELFKGKARLFSVADGDVAEQHESYASWVRRPEIGLRQYGPGHRFSYAEPLSPYRCAFEQFNFTKRTNGDFTVDKVKDPEVELQTQAFRVPEKL